MRTVTRHAKRGEGGRRAQRPWPIFPGWLGYYTRLFNQLCDHVAEILRGSEYVASENVGTGKKVNEQEKTGGLGVEVR